jgi:hypothetical protein
MTVEGLWHPKHHPSIDHLYDRLLASQSEELSAARLEAMAYILPILLKQYPAHPHADLIISSNLDSTQLASLDAAHSALQALLNTKEMEQVTPKSIDCLFHETKIRFLILNVFALLLKRLSRYDD